MRRTLSISLISLALFVAAGAAPAAHAQTCPNGYNYDANAGCQPIQTGAETCAYGYQYDANAGCIPAETTAGTPIDPAAAQTPTQLPQSPEMTGVFATVMTWIMTLFAWLLGIAMITLNYAVYYTVITMGDYVSHLTAVGVTWRILRDVGNIMLIFGFVAVGITTILNVGWYGGGKKMLPMMLVAAVFLNFSLFFAEAIIDTGNLFATQFYTQINGNVPLTQSNLTTQGLSDKIMQQLGLQTIYGGVSSNQDVLKASNSLIVAFMAIILFIVAAFVMFSLAFVLIARFVALVFLLVVAPVGFAGLAIPGFAKRAGQWWNTLFEQTITAPILLLMLYIALAVITDVNFLTGFNVVSGQQGSNWLDSIAINKIATFAPILLSFLVAMGLLIAVVVYAKRWSAFGGDWASRTASKLTFGATAWAGRTTIGWGTHRAAKYLRGTAAGRVPLVGTGLVRGLERVATGSMDIRGTGVLKNMPFGSNIDAGTAQKGGYRADLKGRIESRTKYASELTGKELTDEQKVQQAALQNQIKQLQKNRAKAITEADIRKIDEDIKAKEKDLEKIESVSAQGAQRKYATVLELGLDKKGVFNTYFNFAANTDAAKKIRADAKKAKPDKDWTANMRNLLKEATEEAEGGAGAAAPSAAAPKTPPAGYEQNPGGVILTPSGGGGGPRTS